MKKLILGSLMALTVTACAETEETPVADNGQVNIYSSRHYDTDLALYEDFTRETGIKVNRIEASADALIERITSEGEFSPADLLITVDAGRLWRAEEAGVLSAVESEVLAERLPEHLRHPDGLWFGLSTRARVIIYNKAAGVPEGLDSYANLADSAWKGDICIRSSSNIYNISLLSSIIVHQGVEAAEEWAAGVVANFARPPQGNDTSQIESVAAGECRISVVNSYYLARYAESDVLDAIGVIFPDQGEGENGAHVNVSGAGVTASAPNRENAIAFLEYLTSDSAQSYFANGNNEYPAVLGIEATAPIQALGEFRADTLNASAIGAGQAEAVQIFDRVGWN
ncbi:MAG: Fe(3+) ABC transporter substrate-binding protein [Pseudomonadota bacterium]